MKKLVSLFALSVCTTAAFAQKNSLAVNAGYLKNTSIERSRTSSIFTRGSTNFYDNKDGFKAGVTAARQLSKSFLSLSVNYLNQGYNSGSLANTDFESRARLNVIQSTINLAIPTFKNLYVNVGVGDTYIASVNSTHLVAGEVVAEEKNSDFFGNFVVDGKRSSVQKHSLTTNIGLTYKIDDFDLNLTNNMGLSPFFKSSINKVYLSNIELGVAYRFYKF